MKLKLVGLFAVFFVLTVSIDARKEEEVVSHLRHKVKHHHKKDAKHEYYMSQHVDHPDADAKNIEKHGANLAEASMQADGANEVNGGEKKVNKLADIPTSEMKLQKINNETPNREEKQRNHHHHHHHHHQRHEIKVREEAKSEGSVEEEVMKDETKSDTREERKISKRKDVMEKSESRKVEEVKLEGKSKSEDGKMEKIEEKAEKKTEKSGKSGRKSKNHQDGKKGKGRKHNGQHKGKKHNKKSKANKSQKNGKKQRKNSSNN